MIFDDPRAMNLLAFDTSTDTLSIGVQRGAGEHARTWQHTGPGGAQASATLIPAILQLMQQAGLGFGDLAAIVYGRGPGSFTGLRTACSVAQGLAFGAGAQGIPVLPVDTLLAVAEEARFQWAADERRAGRAVPSRVDVTAMLDARMGELYVQNYCFDSDKWSTDGVCSAMRPEALEPPGPLSLLAGNVFAAYGARLPEGGGGRWSALPTASALLRLAPALLQAGQAVAAEQALPLYIRDKVAQTTQERLLAKSTPALLPQTIA